MSLSKRALAINVPNPVLEALSDLWDPVTNPNGLISLGVAENTLMHDVLSEHLHRNLSLPNIGFTYGDGGKHLRSVLATFLTRHLKPVEPITASQLITFNGCTTGIEHAARSFTDPGEYLLLGRPYYTAFLDDATLRTGSKVAEISFGDDDPLGPDCVAKYEEKILKIQAQGGRVGALILCHPHNPLGRCYPRSVLVDFMKLCQKYCIHLLSDEIYALSIFVNNVDTHPPPTPFQSVLSIDPTGLINPELIHVLWGMSKDFGANGIRMGVIISQHNKLFHECMQPVGLFGSASSLAEHVTTNILEDDAWVESYVAENQRKLSEHYKYVTSWATENSIEYAPGANAGFFIWLNLGKAYLEKHPDAKDNLDHKSMNAFIKARVFLAAGFRFGSEHPGWYRIVFSHDKSYLDKGLDRVLKAINSA